MLDMLDTARARREAELVRRWEGDTALIASTLLCWKYVLARTPSPESFHPRKGEI